MTPQQIDIEDWLTLQAPDQPRHVRLRRIDRERNMARFYALSVQPDLFGMWCFVREWGRIGRSGGQMRLNPYPTATEAHAALERQRRTKERRGYVWVR